MTARNAPPSLDALLLSSPEREELLLLRRLVDLSADIELRDGTWLERHGTKWNVYRNTVAIAVGATIEQAAEIAMGMESPACKT